MVLGRFATLALDLLDLLLQTGHLALVAPQLIGIGPLTLQAIAFAFELSAQSFKLRQPQQLGIALGRQVLDPRGQRLLSQYGRSTLLFAFVTELADDLGKVLDLQPQLCALALRILTARCCFSVMA